MYFYKFNPVVLFTLQTSDVKTSHRVTNHKDSQKLERYTRGNSVKVSLKNTAKVWTQITALQLRHRVGKSQTALPSLIITILT